MTVFLLTQVWYSETEIHGVFRTEELAIQRRDELIRETRRPRTDFFIEEMEVQS